MRILNTEGARLHSERIKSVWLILFSVFIIWHVIGISIVGPTTNSQNKSLLHSLYSGYLPFFHLDRAWSFYAPNPQLGTILRYETIYSSGEKQIHPLTDARNRQDHAFGRFSNVFLYLFEYPQYTKDRGFDNSVARYLCERHREENLHAINFIRITQKKFSHEDYLAGKNPLSEKFIHRQVFGPYACRDGRQ